MRIVHIIPNFGLAGTQKGGCVLALAMARQGHEVTVIGFGGGPRFLSNPPTRLTHLVLDSRTPAEVAGRLSSMCADVVHIHEHLVWAELIEALPSRPRPALIVSTPVFGRPPSPLALMRETRICLVGVYTFYRFCRWTGLSFRTAVEKEGIGYVPITSFEPPPHHVSATDQPASVQARRAQFGIPSDAFVVGRIGRNDIAKWHPLNRHLVPRLLSLHPDIHWLSVGFPDGEELRTLQTRWPTRFHNLPETPDFQLLAHILSSLDVQLLFGRGECFASSIAEAAGAGVPTIALANPLRDNGQAEQVIDGVTGYLVGSVDQAMARVEQILRDRASLEAMKRMTQAHCMERWHADREARDLLSLYAFWRDPTLSPPPYARLMIEEAEAFAARYHAQIVRLMSDGLLARLKWRVLMKAVESRAMWKLGRTLKRLRYRQWV